MFTLPKLETESTYGNGILTCEKVWGINNASEHKEEALTFLNYLVNTTEAVDYLQGDALSGVYATKVQFDHAAANGYSNPYITEAYEKVITCAQDFDNPLSLNSDLNNIVRDELLKVCYLSMTPEDAAAEAISLLQSRIEQLKTEAAQ